MIGIVLAAGQSTRLPNKLLLPIKSGKPLITSAVELCRKVCTETVVVVLKDSPVEAWARHNLIGVQIESDEGKSVVESMLAGLNAVNSPWPRMIFFGDNVYGEEDSKYCLFTPPNAATVRSCENAELDGWMNGSWIGRSHLFGERLALAGWLIIHWSVMRDIRPEQTLLVNLNRLRITPYEVPLGGWCDLGTPEAYREYWSR